MGSSPTEREGERVPHEECNCKKALTLGGPLLQGNEKKKHHVKSKLEGGFGLRGLPYRERERRKIMKRETKREKIDILPWEVAQGERQQGLGIL